MNQELPRLVVITDWSLPDAKERLEDLISLGPSVAVQHRDPTSPVRPFLERARWLSEQCDRTGTPWFVNGRLDVALLVGAHLHLPEDAPSPKEVRPFLPKGRWVSAAVHQNPSRADGADLALVSPVFEPGSKKRRSNEALPRDGNRPESGLLGPAGFFALAQQVPCPAYALGGITEATASLLAGTAGIAVVSAVFSAPSPSLAAKNLLGRI